MTRSGKEYTEGLRDGRTVFIDGETVHDVTRHPAFVGMIESVGAAYDYANAPENRGVMTFPSPLTGRPCNLSYLIPRTEDDLRRRRVALRRTAEQSYGLIGRGPEHVAGFLAGWAGRSDVFGKADPRFAENITRFYEHVRDEDLYCTYAIVPPQIDRSRPAHQQEEPNLYASVAAERDDGIIVRGAQMLGTATAVADYVILTSIIPLVHGDEDYAISVAVPVGAPGVRVHSRRGYAESVTSRYDYPLTSRFDETDALVVFDDVFVPWERVFVYRDRETMSAQWNLTPAHLLGNNQAQVRLATKLDLLAGVTKRVAEMNGSVSFPPVQSALGQIAAYATTISGLVYAQEQECRIDERGVAWPGPAECFAAMTLQIELVPKLVHLVRDLCGGGLIQLPSSARDFANPQAAADLERYVHSPGYPSRERVKLMKFAWDLIGSEFAGRHHQYEMFYAGAPHLVRSRMARVYDFEAATELLDRALGEYTLEESLGGSTMPTT
jgi:4-hydroxyphenylacetate 3-monooxygenase